MDIRNALISWSKSLSGRVLISILLMHVFLLSALFYSVFNIVEENYTDQFIDDVRMDSQRVNQLITYELENNQLQKMQPFIDSLLWGGHLVSVVIRDVEGRIVYPLNGQYEGDEFFHEDFYFGENNDNIYFIKNRIISETGQNIAVLQLAYDEESTVEEISRLYRSGLVIVTIYLVIMIVSTGVVDTYITQPLRNLTRDANRIASGKYKESFFVFSNVNEVNELAESLELMRNELVSRGEMLADKEKRISIILDSIIDAVIVCDQQGHIESVSQAVTAITNFSVNELMHAHVSRIINFDEVIEKIKKPSVDRVYETSALTNIGKKVSVEVNVSELKKENKTLYLVLLRDISERKRNELERYQYHNDMAHAGRLSIMGEMAAGLAHELNQPLAAISLYLQGCVRRCESTVFNKADVLHAITSANEQATRAAGIIRRIKGFVRKEQENENLDVVDTNKLIQRSVRFVLLDKKYSNIHPEISLTDKALKANVDSLQIEQVLVNLIRNAIEAIQSTNNAPRFLKINSEIDVDGSIKVSVIDSGCGVNREHTGKIFDTYFTTKSDGLGMGLAICRSIIEEHDGELKYSPGEQSGSVFYFTLPLHAA